MPSATSIIFPRKLLLLSPIILQHYFIILILHHSISNNPILYFEHSLLHNILKQLLHLFHLQLMHSKICHLLMRLSLSLLFQLTREIFGETVVDHELGLFVVYLKAGEVGDYCGTEVLERGLSQRQSTSLLKM